MAQTDETKAVAKVADADGWPIVEQFNGTVLHLYCAVDASKVDEFCAAVQAWKASLPTPTGDPS